MKKWTAAQRKAHGAKIRAAWAWKKNMKDLAVEADKRHEELDAFQRIRISKVKLPLGLHNSVNHPKHYTSHPSGIECIQITEHMGFCLGNAVKYLWRADLKDDAIEDMRKAIWYIEREIAKRQKNTPES